MQNANENSVCWADQAIMAFQQRAGSSSEDVLTDLLTDLMHWAESEGQDFQESLEIAERHFQEEINHPDE